MSSIVLMACWLLIGRRSEFGINSVVGGFLGDLSWLCRGWIWLRLKWDGLGSC